MALTTTTTTARKTTVRQYRDRRILIALRDAPVALTLSDLYHFTHIDPTCILEQLRHLHRAGLVIRTADSVGRTVYTAA